MIYSVVMFGPWWRVMDGHRILRRLRNPRRGRRLDQKPTHRQRGEIMRNATLNGGAMHALTATELVDLVRSAIPRDAAIDLVAQFCRVVAAGAALEATRETYARVDKVLAKPEKQA